MLAWGDLSCGEGVLAELYLRLACGLGARGAVAGLLGQPFVLFSPAEGMWWWSFRPEWAFLRLACPWNSPRPVLSWSEQRSGDALHPG